MAERKNRQYRLKNRPAGEPTAESFERTDSPIPQPEDEQVLYRVIYLSVDPYMRGRMRAGRGSYVPPVEVGDVMCGGTVGQALASRHPDFGEGDYVVGYGGWQEYAVEHGSKLRKLDPSAAPIAYGLAALGMPGLTAYVAALDIAEVQPGQTVVVSAAAGAVGSVAGQIARIRGCRTVGTAGSDEKCRFVTEDLGFDACINYKTRDVLAGLRRACPQGIDAYIDNVGGDVLAAVLRQINDGARIALIGHIAQYNDEQPPPGPNLIPLLVHRARIQGMIVYDHADRQDDFLRDVGAWLRDGRMICRLDIAEGLDRAPAAFIGLFHGDNIGKQLVRIAKDPTGG